MKKLEQFRKEESELFNSETGEFYRGTVISPRQCELMRDAIGELDQKLSISIAKTAQLVEELIEVKEAKEELLEVLNLIILNEVALEGEGKTCSIPGPIYLKALQVINKAKQS